MSLLLAACGGSPQPRATPTPTPRPAPSTSPSPSVTSPSPSPPSTSPPPAPPPPPPPPEPVTAHLAGLDLDELIGQLVVGIVYGASATEVTDAQARVNRRIYGVDTPAEAVAELGLGGVILIGRNNPDPEAGQVQTGNVADTRRVPGLVAGLQRAAVDTTGIPLLIAADQEGGPVTRLGPPLTQFPAATAVADAGDPQLTRRVYAAIGTELRAVGVDVDFAPVADVNVDPDNPVIGVRAFGDEPEPVSRHVVAAVHGLQVDAGVAATAKHFPGHGDTSVDSHYGVATVDHDLDTIRSVDLPPFVAAIEAGVELVMTGHLVYPAVDDRPATLSEVWLDDWLRGQLGFEGVIVTDSLSMQGVLDHVDDPADVGVAALRAGADLLLMPGDAVAVVDRIRAEVEAGGLDESRLRDSARRVLELKAELGLLDADREAPHLPGDAALEAHDDLRERVEAS